MNSIHGWACGLRVSLFDRGHRTVALTAAGEALPPRARRIVDLFHAPSPLRAVWL
ncbi:hypothetical protein [Streptomyces niveus]|uniref:hypothetical protein n=1 Tax=Streptomyces niveus TaxID=193462 RepID=UPI00362B7DA8